MFVLKASLSRAKCNTEPIKLHKSESQRFRGNGIKNRVGLVMSMINEMVTRAYIIFIAYLPLSRLTYCSESFCSYASLVQASVSNGYNISKTTMKERRNILIWQRTIVAQFCLVCRKKRNANINKIIYVSYTLSKEIGAMEWQLLIIFCL